MASHKVFVYGSLKSGGTIRGLNQFGEGADIVGKATTTYPDYDMVDLGSFPGVFLGGTKYIQGEVWEVDDEVFADLDAIEGYPDFYSRTPTQTSKGKAWMYHLDKKQYGSFYADDPKSDSITEVDNTLIWNL